MVKLDDFVKYFLPFIVAPLLGAHLNFKTEFAVILQNGHYSERRDFFKCNAENFYSFLQKEMVDETRHHLGHSYHNMMPDAEPLNEKAIRKLADDVDSLFEHEPFFIVPRDAESGKSDVVYIKRKSDGKFAQSTISENPFVCDARWKHENS